MRGTRERVSYDLMVFETADAPTDRVGFMRWYEAQTAWTESHGYDDPKVASPALRDWFRDIIREFPPLNGRFATDEIDNPHGSDYSIGQSLIYVGFAWSHADEARATTRRLAIRHGVGFFDVSADDGEILRPESKRGAAAPPRRRAWWKLW